MAKWAILMMDPRRYRRLPLMLPLVFLLSPAILDAHSLRELNTRAETFNKQEVTVTGEVREMVTRYGDTPYTRFVLYDEQNNVVPVFAWGTPTYKQGQYCRVVGTFFTEKSLGPYVLQRGIEAASVTKEMAGGAEVRMESTIFKKKKRTGLRGSRGFYIPQ